MRTVHRFFLAAVAVAVSTSCGDVVRDGRSPVLLVIDSLLAQPGKAGSSTAVAGPLMSDVQVLVTSPAPCTADAPCPTIFNDLGQVTMHLVVKDAGASGANTPSAVNQVTITRYHVSYRRADGRNVEGTDVPFAFDGTVTAAVPGSPFSFELVRDAAKEESPLRQLVNSPTIITAIGDVTFYGTDVVGNDISVTGSITIEFGNFGDS